jgi:protein phosphatase
MSLSLVTAMRSVTGPHRSRNEDSAGAAPAYAFVADGVGGHAGGDVASWTVAHRVMAALATAGTPQLGADELRAAVAVANADLARRVRSEPELEGMATTFTGVFCGRDAVRVVHIGDSRAYLLRDGDARRVTRDDSLVQLLLEAGVIDPSEAPQHPRRNVILHCLAGDSADPAHVTVLEVDARPGDRWLMATDGLTDYLPEERVLELLGSDGGPDEAADALVEAAIDADAWDNVSVVVADVVAADGSASTRDAVLGGAAADASRGVVLDPTA